MRTLRGCEPPEATAGVGAGAVDAAAALRVASASLARASAMSARLSRAAARSAAVARCSVCLSSRASCRMASTVGVPPEAARSDLNEAVPGKAPRPRAVSPPPSVCSALRAGVKGVAQLGG